MKIKTFILLSSLLIALLTPLVMIGGLYQQKFSLSHSVEQELVIAGRDRAGIIAKHVYLMTKAMQEVIERSMTDNLRVAEDVLKTSGQISFDSTEQVPWEALNQYSGAAISLNLPKVKIDGRWLGQNSSMASETAVVDKVRELVGGTCTIFQRMNEAGDMLRVATNVEGSEGTRAIGTYIPRINPDGTANPVIDKVMQGEIFHGRAFVVNSWYITAYQPLYDNQGEIVGVLYVGIKQDGLSGLRDSIMDIAVGQSGYVLVLGGKGDQRGRYIISHRGHRDGENVYDTRDTSGEYFVRRMIAAAVELPPASGADIPVAYDEYEWQNPEDDGTRLKLAGITYFEPWDWVIVAGYYLDDFDDVSSRMGASLNKLILSMIIIAVFLVSLTLALNVLVAQRLFAPLDSTIMALREMSTGNLQIRLPVRGHNEIDQIGSAFNQMSENLQVVTTSRDELDREIEERKEAEQQLSGSERRYKRLSNEFQSVLESIQDSLLLISPELKIIWANKASLAERGSDTPEDVTGRDCNAFLYGRPVNYDDSPIALCFASGEPQKAIDKLEDGRLIGTKAFPVKDSSGRVVNVLNLRSDITEIVQLREEAARHSQLAALGELAAGMAHEINNPNGLILMNLATIKEIVSDAIFLFDIQYHEQGDFELAGLEYSRMRVEVPEMLSEMQQGAQHIKRIVDDLKDFVRMETVGSEQVFDLNNAVEAALRLLTNQIKQSTDHFIVDLAEKSLPLSGNMHRIEQVVMNLVINSIQALTERSQKIMLRTSLDDSGQFYFVEVCDEGCGIDPANLSRLTDPFFTTKRASGGTGLGLSVSARIIKEHRGTLTFSRNTPKGTVVRAQFPAAERSIDV